MDVGIGLPNTIEGTTKAELLEWARRAEARGFSTLGTIDRLVYENYEPLTALTAAGAVTERIGLTSAVILGPLRGNAAALAKQTQSIQALTGNRLTLGIGLGGREDDYEFAGVSLSERAELMDALLESLREHWGDERMGPAAEPPRLLVGGGVQASFDRTARFGDGWMAGGLPPDEFAKARDSVEKAWSDGGREGEPFTSGLAYFGLGSDGAADASKYLTHYYSWLGEETAGFIADSAATDAGTVSGYLSAFTDAGCDELIFFPSTSDPDEVDRLADAAGL